MKRIRYMKLLSSLTLATLHWCLALQRTKNETWLEDGHLLCKSTYLQMRSFKVMAGVQDTFIEKHGVKLGFMSAFVKAAADALHLVPAVNAVIDGDEIVYRDFTDISIAVATPKGLVVPVLRNADLLGFAGVEKVPSAQILAYLTCCCHYMAVSKHSFPERLPFPVSA